MPQNLLEDRQPEYQSKTTLHGGAVEIALPNPPLKDGIEQNTI